MLRRTVLLAFMSLTACAGPTALLPPAATPTPASITPITFPLRGTWPCTMLCLTEWLVRYRALAGTGWPTLRLRVHDLSIAASEQPYGSPCSLRSDRRRRQRLQPSATCITGTPQEGFDFNVQGCRLSNDGSADQIDAQMTAGPGTQPPYPLQLRLADKKPPALPDFVISGVGGWEWFSVVPTGYA